MPEAKIEKNEIVIRLPIKDVANLVEGAWAADALDTHYKVTDTATFAKELVIALGDESENGTTLVHQMFDAAIEQALEQGAEGIEEHENQDA